MNVFFVALAALITVAMITTALAQSTTRTFRDSSGREIGRSATNGNTTTYRDAVGREYRPRHAERQRHDVPRQPWPRDRSSSTT